MDNQLPADPNLDDSNLVPEPTPEEILDQSIAERQIQEQEFQQRQAAAEEAIRAQQEDPGQLQSLSADQMAGVVPLDEKAAEWQSFSEAQDAGPEALEAWYLENTGRTKEEYAQMIADNHDFAGLMKAGEIAGKLTLGAGLGVVDTVVDAMALPGVDRGGLGAEFNKWWDKQTKFENPAYQAARDILGALLPIAGASGAATKLVNATKLTRTQKALSVLGAEIGIDAAFIGVSDQGKEDNLFRTLDDAFPWLEISDDLKTLDDDSTAVRRIKNVYAGTPLAIVGNVLGTTLALKNKIPSFGWFKPKDEQAAAAKKALQQTNNDPETLVKLAEIDEAIASKSLTKVEVKELENTKAILQDQLENKGFSDVTSEPLESGVTREMDLDQIEMDEAAIRKLEADPFTVRYDPVITPALAKPGTVGRSGVKPGAAIRNAGDFTAINKGVVSGDPAPMVSEGVLSKFLKAGGRSRNAVLGLMEAARDAGDYDVVVDKFRFTKSQMDEDAFKWYTNIIGANDVEELRRSFTRDVKNIKGGSVEYLSEDATLGAAFAMRDLTDRYLGRPIAAQSARVMGTLGAEVRTLSESAQMFEGIVDDNVVAEKGD